MAATHHTEFHSVSAHLKRHGRSWMIAIFILLRLADVGLIYFAWHPENPMPLLRGVVLGSVLWSTVLIGCVWQRKAWARYFLIAVLVGVVVLFALALIRMLTDHVRHQPEPMEAAFSALAAYIFCIVPLARSRAILRLSTALGGGQR
jgi:hypothetical protein